MFGGVFIEVDEIDLWLVEFGEWMVFLITEFDAGSLFLLEGIKKCVDFVDLGGQLIVSRQRVIVQDAFR